MKYKLLILLIALSVCACSHNPTCYYYGNCLKVKLREDKTVCICGLTDDFKRNLKEAFHIPETIYGLKVTEIGDHAFKECSSLKEITLPASLKSIGNGAFWKCTHLETISISDGLTTIGDEAFRRCSSLKEITLPASVKSIGVSAFAGCDSLTRVTFADTNSWYVSWTAVNVTNPITNAKYLKNTYEIYHWEKRL
ncbi:MAG: leucine-rich repeat domain-containing protein [Treponema sp.]